MYLCIFLCGSFQSPLSPTPQVDREDRGWSYLFARCAEAQSLFDLEDYSVSQTTLEQVFLEFAKHQLAEDTKAKEKVAALQRAHTPAARASEAAALAPQGHFFPASSHEMQAIAGPSQLQPQPMRTIQLKLTQL
jgi:hypothetical protein